jgi:glutaredoxin
MAPSLSSLVSAPVTVFGAKWCGACRALESGLAARKIAYAVVDVDESPAAFARARNESGSGGAIPLTSVETSQKKVWIVGADVDAVERAQRE